MKTLVLSMISIAATVAAMTACTSESDPIDEITTQKDAKVEIKATAGIGNIVTKAPIDGNFSENLNVLFFKPEDGTSQIWTAGKQIYATIAAASGHAITFKESWNGATKALYYNADANKKSALAGCYLGNITPTENDLTDGKITVTIDGTQDIMATDGQSDKQTASPFGTFTFNHLLAQLEFKVQPKADATAAAIQEIFGDVTSIQVLEQNSKFDLTLSNAPTFEANQTPTPTHFDLSEKTQIATTDNTVGQIMIYPTSTLGQTATPIKLKVFTEKGPEDGYDVSATIGNGSVTLEKSKKYIITLSFSTRDISGEGAVGVWDNGETGEGEI